MKGIRLNPFILISAPLLACLFLHGLSAPGLAGAAETLVLVWEANEEEDLRGYRIYQADEAGHIHTRLAELLAVDIPWDLQIQGLAAFEVRDVPPGYHCWAVTAFDEQGNESGPSNPACIRIDEPPLQLPSIHMPDLHEDGFYGSYAGADPAYEEGIAYTFDGSPGEFLLLCRLWHVDTTTEVEILLNGRSLGFADVTGGQGSVLPVQAFLLPADVLDDPGRNTLSFVWNPDGSEDDWGVWSVEVLELIDLPASGFYGNLKNVPGGDRSRPRAVAFRFDGRQAGAAVVDYDIYDMDFEGELQIYVNGQWFGDVPAVGNNRTLSPTPLVLPDDLLLAQGTNTIVFKHVFNPPRSFIWGVGNVRVR